MVFANVYESILYNDNEPISSGSCAVEMVFPVIFICQGFCIEGGMFNNYKHYFHYSNNAV